MGTYDYHGFCRDLLRTVLVDSKEILPDLKPSAFDITKSSLGGYEVRLTGTRFYHYANSACCVWGAKAEAIEHLMDLQTETDEDFRAAVED